MQLPKVLEPLRHQKYRRMWAGQAVSTLGDGIFLVALVSTVLATRHGVNLGYVLGAESIASVAVALVGGVVADRFRRTRVMVFADSLRFLGAVTFALLAGHMGLPLLLTVAAGMGAGTALFQPAYGAVLPAIVPADTLPAANALRSMTARITGIAGPAIGGIIVSVASLRVAFWCDAASFLLSIVTLIGIAEARREAEGASVWHVFAEAKDGFSAVLSRPWVAVVIGQGTVQLVFAMAPALVLLPLVLSQRGASHAYGLLVALQALGSMLGGLVAGRWRPAERGTVAILGLLLLTGQLLCLAFDVPLAVLAAAMVVTGFGYALFGVLWMSALQGKIPGEVLGRVLSVEMLGTYALEPAGLALAPVAVSAFGIVPVVAAGIITMVVSSAVPLLVPGVRRFGQEEAPSDSRAAATAG